jgi:AbiJ N-terminal domain 4
MLFSKRHGYVKVRDCIQFESIDEVTRNHLWSIYYESPIWERKHSYKTIKDEIVFKIWMEVLNAPRDTIPLNSKALQHIRKIHLQGKWHVVFDILEIISEWFILNNGREEKYFDHTGEYLGWEEICGNIPVDAKSFCKEVNALFEKECVGYRLIDGKVCPITDAHEIEQIEIAVNAKSSPAQTHIQRALELLSDRKQHDYRNSIKESISAVESTVKIISNSEKGTLGELLKRMNLHKAFQSGLSSMYGYTSDADGIRHALMDESTVPFADAKFFLVMCASFINYLHDKNSTVR